MFDHQRRHLVRFGPEAVHHIRWPSNPLARVERIRVLSDKDEPSSFEADHVNPRTVAEPSIPIGYRCVPMTLVAPEAVYEAVSAAALDEPTPIRHDDIRLDDFLREWNEPDADLESSTAVLDESGSVARKQSEGKSRREALRCLKRQLARVVFNTLKTSPTLT